MGTLLGVLRADATVFGNITRTIIPGTNKWTRNKKSNASNYINTIFFAETKKNYKELQHGDSIATYS